jgi:hypothetical protein
MGTDLAQIEKIGVALEGLLKPIPGTRSVFYERNEGGLYVDIVPMRDALARYGLTVGDVERTIEAAIGGAPIGVTIQGRNRFSINVRYPQELRSDLDRLRGVLVPIDAAGTGMSATQMQQDSGGPGFGANPTQGHHPRDESQARAPGRNPALRWQGAIEDTVETLSGETVTPHRGQARSQTSGSSAVLRWSATKVVSWSGTSSSTSTRRRGTSAAT